MVSPSNLSIFYQLPQNIFMGSAEVFASVGSLEFAYSASPRSGQSEFISLHFVSRGIASFLGIGYLSIYSSGNSFNFDVCILYYHHSIFHISQTILVYESNRSLAAHILLFYSWWVTIGLYLYYPFL